MADSDQELFDRLRAVRLRIARERGVPPYVIFHDTTLRELARLKPQSVEALSGVYGIGARKAEQLGEAFVEAIGEWRRTSIPNSKAQLPINAQLPTPKTSETAKTPKLPKLPEEKPVLSFASFGSGSRELIGSCGVGVGN